MQSPLPPVTVVRLGGPADVLGTARIKENTENGQSANDENRFQHKNIPLPIGNRYSPTAWLIWAERTQAASKITVEMATGRHSNHSMRCLHNKDLR